MNIEIIMGHVVFHHRYANPFCRQITLSYPFNLFSIFLVVVSGFQLLSTPYLVRAILHGLQENSKIEDFEVTYI